MANSKFPLLSAACLTLGIADPAHAAFDILGCATRAREAITPSDPLDCHGKEGAFESTLVDLYGQGWRLIDAEYFAGDEPVFYLERAIPAVAVPAPTQKDDPAELP